MNFLLPRAQRSIEADWYVLIQVNPKPRATITKLQRPKATQFRNPYLSESCHSGYSLKIKLFIIELILLLRKVMMCIKNS